MTRFQRQAITAVALSAAVLAPKTAVAQRQNQPIPIFLAVTFHSPGEPKLGIEAAEAVRQRMSRIFPQPPRSNGLRIVTQQEINSQLNASGYPADSAITTTDLRDLGKGMGAAESMEGQIRRTADGVEARARFYVLSNIGAPEVLPVVVEKNADAAGRKIADLYAQARKELPEYERCKNALIQRQYDVAVTAAKAAMQQYDKGVLPRACLLTAYTEMQKQNQMPLDSVMKVANEIVAIDSTNEIAIGQLVDAYRTRGDTARAIELSMKLYALNPANTTQAHSIIDVIAGYGAPEKALVIVEDMMKNNPGDADIIETQWKLLQAMQQWKRAIASGEEMVKFDTAKADTTYFLRQTGAALQDSQPQLALQFLARATQKFPRNVRFLQAYGDQLRRQGQVQQALEVAKKVIAVDPKADQGFATVVVLYTQLGQADSAVAFAKQALAGSPDEATKESIGKGLLALIAPAMSTAQADTSSPANVQKENWAKVLHLSAAVDSIAPTPNTAFYMSVAAYYVAQHGLSNLGEVAKTDKAQACTLLKEASDNLLIVDLNMSRGGRVDPATAGALLTATGGTLKPYIESARKQLACK